MLSKLVSTVLGLVLIGGLWWLGLRRRRSLQRALITEATIIEMIPVESVGQAGRVSHVPRLKFRAHDGTEHVVTRTYSTFTFFKPEFAVGQTVSIAYDPETHEAEIVQPSHAIRALQATLVLFTLAILGILFVVIFG